MVLSSCEHPEFSFYVSWAWQSAHETQRPWEQGWGGEDLTLYQESLMRSSIVSWSHGAPSLTESMVSWSHCLMSQWNSHEMLIGVSWSVASASPLIPSPPSSLGLVILWASNILMLYLMSTSKCSWDTETKRTGLGWGGSDSVPWVSWGAIWSHGALSLS